MSTPVYKVEGLGQRIRELRSQKGYTQAELAKRVGVGRSTMATYECGKEAPSYAKLIRLARELNVSTDYLLGYDIDTQLDLSGIDGENKENVLRLAGMLKEPVK